jgi:membrane protein
MATFKERRDRLIKSNTVSFARELYQNWNDDHCFRLGAALSYYTLFSIAPLLVIIISVTSYFLGEDAIRGELFGQIRSLVGPEGAAGIQTMVEAAYKDNQGLLPTLIGAGTLFLSATLLFMTIQDSLNEIWGVRAKPEKGWVKMIKDRALSFSLVLGIGFGLLSSLMLTSIISALMGYLGELLGDVQAVLVRIAENVVSLGIITVFLAMLYKFLPDAKLQWKDTWRAAILTAILFTLGKFAIGAYLGSSNMASTYGAAAGIVILIVWVNYTSWILFFGAEYMKVYTKRRGRLIQPSANAVRVIRTEVERDVDGSPDYAKGKQVVDLKKDRVAEK